MAPMLSGFTALDLTELTGQFTGRFMADLGMRVVKVEPPGGDLVRTIGPFKDDTVGPDNSLRFAFLNGGKESVTLNIGTREGQEMLLSLVEHVDVVLESFPPGFMGSLGLGYPELSERNPALVVASVTGFGQWGPRSWFLAPDIVGVAMGGLMFISGDPELAPVMPPETQSYYYACAFASYGVLLALLDRAKTGRGQYIDVSAQESIATQEHMIREAAFDGVEIKRNGSQHKHAAPANIFPCTDGHVYLFILGARDWQRFLELWADHPAELDDDALKPPHKRRAVAGSINPLVEQFTRRYKKKELTMLLQEHGIPCLPVNSPNDFLAEDQVRARGFVGELESPTWGRYLAPLFPVLIDGKRPPPAGPPPLCGQDNGRVFGEWLGLGPKDIELLAARGVI